MKTSRKAALWTCVAAVALSAATFGGIAMANAEQPCATEDANDCYWDAQKQGNGEGRSFSVDGFGNVTYWDGRP